MHDFYDVTAPWLATSEITATDRRRAAHIDRLGGRSSVLEVGAGFGGSAAAAADLGHDVTAIERSPRRADVARRHLLVERAGRLRIIEGDLLTVALETEFDVVVWWSGFGVGPVEQHAAMLGRLRRWLRPSGRCLVDVFDPAWWRSAAGRVEERRGVRREFDFVPPDTFELRYRVLLGSDRVAVERVRCYEPDSFTTLCRDAGFAAHRVDEARPRPSHCWELVPR